MAKHSAQPDQSALPAFREGLKKREIATLADQSVENVLEEGNVFQVAEALAAMDEFVKAVRKDERFVQFLREELAKHQGKLITHSGARIELCESGVSYDYSCNPEWLALDAEMHHLQEQKKELEAKIRSVAAGKMAVDPETGELIEGVNRTSKSTYRITLSR